MSSATAPAPIDLRGSRTGTERLKEQLFQGALLLGLLVALGFLVILLYDIISSAIPLYQDRGMDFITGKLSNRITRTGLSQAITGSFQIALVTMTVAFPLGLATAVYLEEYARDNLFTRLVDINIRNLAGVPSIVYGILGFAIYVNLFRPLTGGSTGLSGGLTLATLALPIVVIASAEAIRAVPNHLREAGYGLGATRWQVTRQLVLPAATPGVMTGMILALARAIGETAPLLVIGAATFLTVEPGLFELRESFTALPMVIFGYSKVPQREFIELATPAAIVVLLAFTLTMNGVAIYLRNRFEKKL